MSRFFDGSAGSDEFITLDNGLITTGGPITILFLWIPSSGEVNQFGGLIAGMASGNEQWDIHCDGGLYFTLNDFSGFDGVTDNAAQIIGYSKASGSNTVTWHHRDSTGWSHGNGATEGDGSTIDAIQIGEALSGRLDGFWVCAAIWNSALSDIDVEAAGSLTALQAWFDASPTHLWAGNQANTSEDVVDLMSNGADQIATLNPAVSSTEPPGWSYEISEGDQDLNIGFHDQVTTIFAPVLQNQSALNLSISFKPSSSEVFQASVTNQDSLNLNISFKSSSSTIFQPTISNEGDQLFEPTLLGNGSLADRILAGLIDQGFTSGSLADREYLRLLAKLGLSYTGAQTLADLYELADETNRIAGLELFGAALP